MSETGHFHSLRTLTQQDVQDGKTREFAGDGSPFLRVTGLVELEAVRVGGVEIPLVQEREYPQDPALQRLEKRDEPLVRVERDAAGPVLLRSILSNNGLWQQGVPVFVTGEWEG